MIGWLRWYALASRPLRCFSTASASHHNKGWKSPFGRILSAGQAQMCDHARMGLLRSAGVNSVLLLLSYLLTPAAKAQFKEVGPPPFSQAVAQQKIRGLLDNVDTNNRRQTVDSLNALTPWFRNILDEELIRSWQSEKRDRLTLVLEPLADTRVAAAVVEFSWHKRTESTFNLG